ncbi:Zinc finger protein 225, partial [Eumeta japonica]
ALPRGSVCGECANRAAEACAFQKLVSSRCAGAPDSLSEKIRTLRRRLHQLTQQVDVFIVVGEGGGGAKPTYSERDIIMVDRDALAAAAAYDDGSALGVDADARGDTVYQCSVCPQSFRKAAEYAAHAATHPNESVHSCWTCGAQFPSRAALAAHRPLHESTLATTSAPCHLCGATFASVPELRRHEVTCEARCPVCGELFSSRATLSRHAVDAHGRAAPPPHLCPVCFESFERAEQLTAHALHHRQARQFVCGYDGCILRFAARENLLSHIRKCHSGTADDEGEPADREDVTPALVPTCRDCGRTFGSTAALKRHARVYRRYREVLGARTATRVDPDSSADEDVVAAAAALINERHHGFPTQKSKRRSQGATDYEFQSSGWRQHARRVDARPQTWQQRANRGQAEHSKTPRALGSSTTSAPGIGGTAREDTTNLGLRMTIFVRVY